MQHTTIGDTTTFYSTTEESRIDNTVSSDNIRFLVKFTNDFSKQIKYAYGMNQIINNRYTSFEILHSNNEDLYKGQVNLAPAGYWAYEVYEVSWEGSVVDLAPATAPSNETEVLTPRSDNGVNNGRIEIGKMLSSDTELANEIIYSEYNALSDDVYIYPFADSTVSYFVDGCTDPNFYNYNRFANRDDGSCIAIVYGCTDPNSTTYNVNANVDNGTCDFDGVWDSNAYWNI